MRYHLRRQYKFYKKNLFNYSAVLKDTQGEVSRIEDCDYNCMSYAFGVFNDWLQLDNFHPLINDNYFKASKEEQSVMMQEMLNKCCKEIIERFGCRRIVSPSAARAGERVIAFRIGSDDFHFTRLNSDGTWTHKPGGNYIRVMDNEELYSEEGWCSDIRRNPYISSLIFFAI